MSADRFTIVIASLIALLIVALLSMIAWVIAASPSYSELAERHLGDGAVCGYLRAGVVRCTKNNQLYTCIVQGERVGCGLVVTPLEAP